MSPAPTRRAATADPPRFSMGTSTAHPSCAVAADPPAKGHLTARLLYLSW